MRTKNKGETYTSLKPMRPADKTLAPQDQVEAWLKNNTIRCGRLQARVTAEKCQQYAKHNPESCYGCQRNKKGKAAGNQRGFCTIDGCGNHLQKDGLCLYHLRQSQKEITNPGSPWRGNPAYIPQAIRKEVLK